MTDKQLNSNTTDESKIINSNEEVFRIELESLQHQVKSLQNKPWFKEGGVVVAVLALIVSIVSIGLQYRQTSQETAKKTREELRFVLNQVQSLRSEFHSMVASVDDPKKKVEVEIAINQRALILLEKAESLISEIPAENITMGEFSTFGNLLLNFNRLDTAHKYLEAAAEKAKSPLEIAGTKKDVARALFAKREFEAGRLKFTEALASVEGLSDLLAQFQVPFIYEVWGEMERLFGNTETASQYLLKAKKYYEELKDIFGDQAKMGLMRVNSILQTINNKEILSQKVPASK